MNECAKKMIEKNMEFVYSTPTMMVMASKYTIHTIEQILVRMNPINTQTNFHDDPLQHVHWQGHFQKPKQYSICTSPLNKRVYIYIRSYKHRNILQA